MTVPRTSRILDIGLAASALAAAILALTCAVRLHKAEARSIPNAASFSIGASLPRLTVFDRSGAKVDFEFAGTGRPTLLYVSTPVCIWCKRNLPNLRALMTSEHGRLRVVGLSLQRGGVDDYLARNGLRFDQTGYGLAPMSGGGAGFSGTPEALLIDSRGFVQIDVRGAWAGSGRDAIERYFKIKLPGLAEVPE